MNRLRSIAPAWLGVALALGALSAAAQETSGDVKRWLDRMNAAVEKLNYRGSYVHVVDGNPETLHIVHRYADGVVGEKISSNAENGREFLRTEDLVRSVFPEKRLVVVVEPEHSSIPVAPSLNYTEKLEDYYQMTTFPKGSVAGRETQVVLIHPRDEFRYGYLLWLDRETALPLKIHVRDENARVIESILFTEIKVLDSIPEFALAPSTSLDGFTLKQSVSADDDEAGSEIWRATRLPNGFYLSTAGRTPGSHYPMQHLVYTDGLATVSVFIAHPKADADIPEGFSRFGSTNAFSLMIDGRRATAIGEVPGRTVQGIATSLNAR